MNFYSERGEDAFLARSGLLPAQGVYVDVGCNQPFLGNNCAFLRERGWRGLNIDAIDYSALYPEGTFVQAIVSSFAAVPFRDNCNPVLARVCGEGQLRDAHTLEYLLERCGIDHIDVLSMDCEGHEQEVWESMDFAKHRPSIVISEYLTAPIEGDGEPRQDLRLFTVLIALGYRLIHDSGINHIFHLK